MKKTTLWLALAGLALFTTACEREAEIPPTIELKSGATYTSSDKVVAKGAAVTVGVVITKVEDELKTLNASVSYDGASGNTSQQNFTISGDPETFEQDITFNARNQDGTEKWYFTVTDSDGNIAQTTLTLTVQ